MSDSPPRRGLLLGLAAEGVAPILGGCAGALVAGPAGGLVGAVVGRTVEKFIDLFGGPIVKKWGEWFQGQPPEARQAAVAELAALPPEEARQEVEAALDRLAPEASPEDRSLALEYLTAIPLQVDRALVPDASGARTVPATISFDEPALLLELLPTTIPPYRVPTLLSGTPYVLDSVLGTGGFGAVYHATAPSLQHLPFAIKFCLDANLVAALHRERSNLERLMRVGGKTWSARIVRLYGYDLDHKTPYLVYEFVPGGDLTHHIAKVRQGLGRPLNADEVLDMILQIVEGLSFAHSHGLVHRDLKPANVLVDGNFLKLADFGLGGIAAAKAQVSRIGTTTMDYLTLSDRASLFRGAGTPLYMSPEQRRGAPPDPRQDLYSLGVMWYQLLTGDVTRELHPGWAKELTVRHQVPPAHLDLIARCVGWVEERPKDASELLPLLVALRSGNLPVVAAPSLPSAASAQATAVTATPGDPLRQSLLLALLKQLRQGQEVARRFEGWRPVVFSILPGFLLFLLLSIFIENAGEAAGGGVYALLVAAALFALFRAFNKRATSNAREALRKLSQEFPEQVRIWGGPTVLETPATLAEVLRRLEPPPMAAVPSTAAVPPTGSPTLDPQQRQGLHDGLLRVKKARAAAAWFGERRFVPWWLALIVAVLFFGVPVGIGAGLLYAKQHSPLRTSHTEQGRTVSEYFDWKGETRTEVAYNQARRQLDFEAAFVGILSGLSLTAIMTLLLSWLKMYRWATLLAFLGSAAVLGAPAGVIAGLLYEGYYRPDSRTTGPWSNTKTEYYSYRGETLEEVGYDLELRHREVVAVVLGLSVGTGLSLAGMAIFLWRYGRRHRLLSQQAAGCRDEFAAAFPAITESWGGIERLRDPEFIEEALEKAEAKR